MSSVLYITLSLRAPVRGLASRRSRSVKASINSTASKARLRRPAVVCLRILVSTRRGMASFTACSLRLINAAALVNIVGWRATDRRERPITRSPRAPARSPEPARTPSRFRSIPSAGSRRRRGSSGATARARGHPVWAARRGSGGRSRPRGR